MNYRYSINQSVFVELSWDRWMGDATVAATIQGYESYFNNASPVYIVKIAHSGEIIGSVDEERIKESK